MLDASVFCRFDGGLPTRVSAGDEISAPVGRSAAPNNNDDAALAARPLPANGGKPPPLGADAVAFGRLSTASFHPNDEPRNDLSSRSP